MEVSQLSDDELRERLLEFGLPVSDIPISSSREYFERRLKRFLGGEVDSFSGQADDDDEYSLDDASSGSPKKRSLRSRKSSGSASSAPHSSPPKVRLRTTVTESLGFDHNRHTPSPRPSLRSLSTYSKSSVQGELSTSATRPRRGFCSRVLVKCFIIVILAIVAYVGYVYFYSDSPLKSLEKLARDALKSAEKVKKVVTTTSKSAKATTTGDTKVPKV